MKKIIEIFLDDLKRIKKSKMAIVILIGLLFIPGIYAWLNIDSNWNPYDNTGNIPVAIVNKDSGATIFGETINIGNELETSLKSNTGMKWVFTDYKDAKNGTDKGKYYGAIVIPEDFSQSVLTIMDDNEIKKPEFDFYINNKKNAIAPIIVNKAVGTIQTNLNQSFVNTVIYKVVEKTENINLITKSVETTTELTNKLNDTKDKIEQLRAIINTISNVTDSTKNSLSSVKAIIPNISNTISETTKGLEELKNSAQSFNSAYEILESDLVTILDQVNSNINNALSLINNSNASNNINSIYEHLSNASNLLKSLDNTLSTINSVINLNGIKELDNKVKDVSSKVDTLLNVFLDAKKASENISEYKSQINTLHIDAGNLRTIFNNNVKKELKKVFNDTSNSLNNISSKFSNSDTLFNNINNSLDSIISTLESGTELNNNIDTVLKGYEDDLDKLILIINDVKHGELYNSLVSLLGNKPNEVADFLSSPVNTNKHDLYEIDSYGSKMTPFYSTLACWVGCTILTALLKITVKKSKVTEGAKDYEIFFGRYFLFAVLAMVQGLVIGIGDIILKVQTINPILFLLTLMLSSVVFVLIIYSLAIAFGKIGQALAIVIMVMQVAGSGGTFPIELLPRTFQVLQPFMPFYPAMNAVRETIGGFYKLDYLVYILLLLCHIIIPLILGLVVSKFTNKVKEKLEKEIEKTDILG